MTILKYVLMVLFVLVCIIATVLVLMQEGRSQGLGAIAGAAETYWGKNKGRSMEGNLVKWTKILAVVFFLLAIVLNLDIFNIQKTVNVSE